MKKWAGIWLFLCLTTPFLGSYGWLILSKQTIRKEIKSRITRGIDKSQLVLLTFSQDEIHEKLRWEHEGEFEYRGHMYDVVEMESTGHTVSYWCWPDDKETALNRQIRDLVSKALETDPRQQKQAKRFFAFFHLSFLQDHFSWAPRVKDHAMPYRNHGQFACLPGFLENHSPPPKICL